MCYAIAGKEEESQEKVGEKKEVGPEVVKNLRRDPQSPQSLTLAIFSSFKGSTKGGTFVHVHTPWYSAIGHIAAQQDSQC